MFTAELRPKLVFLLLLQFLQRGQNLSNDTWQKRLNFTSEKADQDHSSLFNSNPFIILSVVG
jgi:hypothetical protein